jgi:hypothetical protein
MAQLVTKVSELIEHSVALLIVDEGKWSCLGRRFWALSWSLETHTTDISSPPRNDPAAEDWKVSVRRYFGARRVFPFEGRR